MRGSRAWTQRRPERCRASGRSSRGTTKRSGPCPLSIPSICCPGASLFFESAPAPLLGNVSDREGDEIGACVAAETEEACDEALGLLEIEWEILPHILDPKEAVQPGAPVIQPDATPDSNIAKEDNWAEGDVEAGFTEADHVVEYDRYIPIFNNHKPNPLTIVAWWQQDPLGGEGETLYIEGDLSDHPRRGILKAFNLPEDKLHWRTVISGAHYCDHLPRRLTILAPLLAKRAGRPVRIAHTRRDNFDVGGHGHDHVHMKIGFTDEGMLTAAEGRVISSSGVRGVLGNQHTLDALITTRCPNIKNETKYVWTNTVRTFAEPGSPIDWEVLTTAMWRIADKLGMDPTEVALKNCHTPEPSLRLCIEKGKAAIDWDRNWHAPGTRKLPNGKMHGLGFRYHDAPRHSHAMYTCTLALKSDGKVYSPYRGHWRGVYGEDACAMVIAEEVGARPEDVIIQYDYLSSATARGGGSDGGGASTWVAKEAAIDLKALLLKTAAARFEVSPDDLDTRDSRVYFKANPERSHGFGEFATDMSLAYPRDLVVSYTGRPPLDVWSTDRYRILRTMNVVFCEVEVDCETGHVDITRWVAACDVGKALRPSSVEGQIEGQLIMNTGVGKMEDHVWDKPTGVLLNGNDLEYKLPTILDTPPIDPLLIETRLGNGCYGATGISHQIIDKGIVACAVQNAIGIWIDDMPVTPDKVLKALGKV